MAVPRVAISFQSDDVAVAAKIYYWLLEKRLPEADVFFYPVAPVDSTSSAAVESACVHCYRDAELVIAVWGNKYDQTQLTAVESSVIEQRHRKNSSDVLLVNTGSGAPGGFTSSVFCLNYRESYTRLTKRGVPGYATAHEIARLAVKRVACTTGQATLNPDDITRHRHLRPPNWPPSAEPHLLESLRTNATLLAVADKGRRNLKVRRVIDKLLTLSTLPHGPSLDPKLTSKLEICMRELFLLFRKRHENVELFNLHAASIVANRVQKFFKHYLSEAQHSHIERFATLFTQILDGAPPAGTFSLDDRQLVHLFQACHALKEPLSTACVLGADTDRFPTQLDTPSESCLRDFRRSLEVNVGLRRPGDGVPVGRI